jgi:hypothetical protein
VAIAQAQQHNGSGVGDIATNGTDVYESYDTNNGTIFSTADKLLTGSGQNIGWTDLTFYDWAAHCFVLKAAGGGGGGSAIASIIGKHFRSRRT